LAAEVDFVMGLFEQQVKIEDVFAQDEMIDVIGTTKGCLGAGVTFDVSMWR
jgi:ribosomal protein L3